MRPSANLTFLTFALAPSNRSAYEACLSFARSTPSAFNPLFLYGPTGGGKTHLLHSIANEVISSRPEREVVLETSEHFTNELIDSIRYDRVQAFRDKYRQTGLLALDDIHTVSGKERTQEEIFFTLDYLVLNGARVVLVSSYPPSEVSALSELLSSRMSMGLVVELRAPTSRDLRLILTQKYASVSPPVPPGIIATVSRKMRDDVRRAEGIVNRLLFAYSRTGKYVSAAEVARWCEGGGAGPAVFLSYAWADKKAVLAVDQWLRDQGARVILDERDFWVGDDIQEHIIRCIRQAGIIVCFYSRRAAQRPYPVLERRLAEEFERLGGGRAGHRSRVIYFCLDDTALPVQQRFRLAVMAKGKSFDEACTELWRGITQTIGIPRRADLAEFRRKPPW